MGDAQEDGCLRIVLEDTINELAALKPISTIEHKLSVLEGRGDEVSKHRVAEETSLILPSHQRLVNYRQYISDKLNTTDITKLDQRIHKQATRYKTRCGNFLQEIQEQCDK